MSLFNFSSKPGDVGSACYLGRQLVCLKVFLLAVFDVLGDSGVGRCRVDACLLGAAVRGQQSDHHGCQSRPLVRLALQLLEESLEFPVVVHDQVHDVGVHEPDIPGQVPDIHADLALGSVVCAGA